MFAALQCVAVFEACCESTLRPSAGVGIIAWRCIKATKVCTNVDTLHRFIKLGRVQCVLIDMAFGSPALVYNTYGYDDAHTDAKARQQSNSLMDAI
eukprot:6502899-Alexandrium_andersonii.AAC.1